MKKIVVLFLAVLLILSLAACADNSVIEYNNIVSSDTQDELAQIMTLANISAERQQVFFNHVNHFNSIINEKSLVVDYEELNTDISRYDPYEMQDQWNAASPDFMGYNCRITAFGLFRDFVNIQANSEKREDMIIFDLVALEEDPSVLLSGNDKDAFSVLYSTVPTTLTKDVDTHIKNLKDDWKNRGISFSSGEKARLISVVLHDSYGEDDNCLFIGHTGVLIDMDGKLCFIEKIAFQEPYQLTMFESRSQLNTYLMSKYDISYDQPTASPFIMENDSLMEGYSILNKSEE